MGKKGQVVLYVILGVLLLILSGIIFFSPNDSEVVQVTDIELSNVRTSAKFYVEVCLDQTTLQAVDEYGFLNADDKIAAYVNENLLSCLNDFDVLRIQGFKIEYQEPQANVILNDNVLFVDLWFPVTVSKGDKQVTIEDFQYTLKRRVTLKTEDGMIPAGTTFFSEDEDFVLIAEQDTYVFDAEGNKAKQITLKINDRLFNGLRNDIVVGNVIYEGLADGLTFSPPLKGNLRVRKKDVPLAYPPASAKLSWFDKNTKIWKSYLFQGYEEDQNYYYYSASIDHLTPIAVVICSDPQKGSFQYPMSYVYEQPISPGDEPLWRDNSENSKFKEGKHLIPELMKDANCTISDAMNYDAEETIEKDKLCTKDGLLKDWDEDDKPEIDTWEKYNDYTFNIGDQAGNVAYDDGLFKKDGNDYDPRETCYDSCWKQVKADMLCYFNGNCNEGNLIDKAFSEDESLWYNPYEEIDQSKKMLKSGDGIYDLATITCSLEGTYDGAIYDIKKDSEPKCVIGKDSVPDPLDLEPEKIKVMDKYLSIKSTLELKDPSKKFYATPMTYGYEKVDDVSSEVDTSQEASEETLKDHVGGRGYFKFSIEGQGDGCVDLDELNKFMTENPFEAAIAADQSVGPEPDPAESTDQGEPADDAADQEAAAEKVALFDEKGVISSGKISDMFVCDKEDLCAWKLNNQIDVDGFKNLELSDLAGKLKAGENIITVDVKNTKNTFAYAQGYLHISGIGISQDESNKLNNANGDTSTSLAAPGDIGAQMGGADAASMNLAPGDFQKIFPGIEIKAVDTNVNPEIQIPRHVKYYVVKIDLEQPGIGFYVTPKSDSLQGTSTFMTNYLSKKLVVAINGGGFEWGGGNENVNGYAMSEGKVYSKSNIKPNGATVHISDKNTVTIGVKNDDGDWNAVTGFQRVVFEGKVEPRIDDPNHKDHKPGYDIKDPRTSVGLVKKDTGEGYKYMILVVVDGRGESQGVDLKELALIQLFHKADVANNNDGGGSTTLVVNNNGVPTIVNKPSDPQGERAVANHLGVTLDLQLAQTAAPGTPSAVAPVTTPPATG